MSAAQVARAGFRTVLDGPGEESYMMHKKTGEKTQLRLENGVYVFDLWVKEKAPF